MDRETTGATITKSLWNAHLVIKRVSGGRRLEIHQQKSCRERKMQRDQEKHNQERLREQTGKTGWICGACHAASTRKDAWKRHATSRCAAISDTSHPDHEEGPEDKAQLVQDDSTPDATARIRAHDNGESRERRVSIRGKQRDNACHGSQHRSIRSGWGESQEDQRRSVQGAPIRKETRRDVQDAGFNDPIVRVGLAVALWYEFGWLLLYVIRALFSSHQCCTLVGLISGAPMLCLRSRVSSTVSIRSESRYAAMLFFFPGTGDRRPLSWTGPISS